MQRTYGKQRRKVRRVGSCCTTLCGGTVSFLFKGYQSCMQVLLNRILTKALRTVEVNADIYECVMTRRGGNIFKQKTGLQQIQQIVYRKQIHLKITQSFTTNIH